MQNINLAGEIVNVAFVKALPITTNNNCLDDYVKLDKHEVGYYLNRVNKKPRLRELYRISRLPKKINDSIATQIIYNLKCLVFSNVTNVKIECDYVIYGKQLVSPDALEDIVSIYQGRYEVDYPIVCEYVKEKAGYNRNNYKDNITEYFKFILEPIKEVKRYDGSIVSKKELLELIEHELYDYFNNKPTDEYILVSNDFFDIMTCCSKKKIKGLYSLTQEYRETLVEIINDIILNNKQWYTIYQLGSNPLVEALCFLNDNKECNRLLDTLCNTRKLCVKDELDDDTDILLGASAGGDDLWTNEDYRFCLCGVFDKILRLSAPENYSIIQESTCQGITEFLNKRDDNIYLTTRRIATKHIFNLWDFTNYPFIKQDLFHDSNFCEICGRALEEDGYCMYCSCY